MRWPKSREGFLSRPPNKARGPSAAFGSQAIIFHYRDQSRGRGQRRRKCLDVATIVPDAASAPLARSHITGADGSCLLCSQ